MFKIDIIPSDFDYSIANSKGVSHICEWFFANDLEEFPSHIHWYLDIEKARLAYNNVKHLIDLNQIKTMSFNDSQPYIGEI